MPIVEEDYDEVDMQSTALTRKNKGKKKMEEPKEVSQGPNKRHEEKSQGSAALPTYEALTSTTDEPPKKKKKKHVEESTNESTTLSQLMKGKRSKSSKKAILTPIVEHHDPKIAESVIGANAEIVARMADEPERGNDKIKMARMVVTPEPQEEYEELVEKVAEPEPTSKKLRRKFLKMADKEKKKKKALEQKEAGSKGEMPKPDPSSPNDSLVQTRIIETVIAAIENELSPMILRGSKDKLFIKPP